jgi:uncharacterized membrane protein YdjX (TVP38/TMEM64 family)
LILVAIIAGLLLLLQRLQLGGQIERCVAFFRAAGPVPFFLGMAVLPVFGFPVVAFTVTAGPVFGATMGVGNVILCAIAAEAVNMAICYWLAAGPLHPWGERLAAWLGYKLPEVPVGSAWEVTLIVRIIPGPPFFLQNYLLGFARVPFGIYLLVSTLVHVVFVIAAIMAGDAFTRRDPRALAVGVLLFAAGAVAVYRLRRRWAKSAAKKSEQ